MRCTPYTIGRVGALAVALGVGAAVASTAGVASAETPDSDTSSASASASAESESESGSEPEPQNKSATGTTTEETSPKDEDPDDEPTPEDDTEAGDGSARNDGSTDEVPSAAVSKADRPRARTVERAKVEADFAASVSVSHADSDDLTAPPTAPVERFGAANRSVPAVVPEPSSGAGPAEFTSVAISPPPSGDPVDAQAVVALTAAQRPSQPMVDAAVSPVPNHRSVIVPDPAPTAPRLRDLLTWVSLAIQRTFFNRTPTTAYRPTDISQTIDGDGSVTRVIGDLVAIDSDGDPLRFTVTQAPRNGSVVVNADGTFVYTPGRELAAAGGTDQFVVKVADVGWHLHGLLSLFKPDFGRSKETVVDVGVTANCGGFCQPSPFQVLATIDVGDGPSGVALNPAGTRAYVANNSDGTVSVVNTATNAVTATITVGADPRGVAINPAGTRVYVANGDDGTVSVIRTSTNTVIATIPVGTFAREVAVSNGGTRLFVIGGQGSSTLTTISTATNTVTATVDLNGQGFSLAVDPQGGRVFVGTQIDWLEVVDTVTNTVTHVDSDAGQLTGIVFNALGTRAYISNPGNDVVLVLDTNTFAVVDTIPVGSVPEGLALSPDGSRLYVVNQWGHSVSEVRTSTNTVITTIDVGFYPKAIVISPDGTRAYVTSGGTDEVVVLQLV